MIGDGPLLVVAAHPDDEVLGCGGTIARLAAEGRPVHLAILGEGMTSRVRRRDDADDAALRTLHACSRRAAERLGASGHSLHDLPDNRFDTVPLLDVVKIVEELIARVHPAVVLTHHGGDLNVDHEVVHRAVLTATRPLPRCPVRQVLAFEVLSSTEWSFARPATTFAPNVFVDVEATLEAKVEAMMLYASETRSFPHPRSPEAMRAQARLRGSTCGLPAAEAFQLVRATW